MKITAVVHKYPPMHLAGAEFMLHAILLDLQRRGHDVSVLYPGAPRTTYEGVPVDELSARKPSRAAQVADADVLITHLDVTPQAIALAAATGKPLVHLVHNDKQLAANNVEPADTALVVFNSRWLAQAQRWPGRALIARPHVAVDKYRTQPTGDHITLVNLTVEKGAPLFYAMAAAMPERSFLAVRGGYGQQLPARDLPNVTTIHTTNDMAHDVYERSRIVVMPSNYESWGRVAVEAACSGIPVIAAPTPGLRESLGRAGLFAQPSMLVRWMGHVRALDSPSLYTTVGARLFGRACDLERETQADLDALAAALVTL